MGLNILFSLYQAWGPDLGQLYPKGVKNRDSLSRCSFILQSQVSNSVIMTWTWKELGISEAKRH